MTIALTSGQSWAIALLVLAVILCVFAVRSVRNSSRPAPPGYNLPESEARRVVPDPARMSAAEAEEETLESWARDGGAHSEPRGERCSICEGAVSCRLCAKGAPYAPAYCPHRLAGHPQTAAPLPLAPIDPATWKPEPGRTFDSEEFLADIPTLADEHLEKHLAFAGIEDAPVVVQIPKVAVAIVKHARAKKRKPQPKKPHGRK